MSPSVTRREKYASRPSRVSCGGPMMSRCTEKTLLDLPRSCVDDVEVVSARHEHQLPAVGQPDRVSAEVGEAVERPRSAANR